MIRSAHRLAPVIVVAIMTTACASLMPLARIIAPPKFEQAPGERAEVRIIPPGPDARLGGASVRIWTQITNPNPFGIRLRTLDGDLFLEGARAATATFPLGFSLRAQGDSVVPLDVRIDFADVPGLGGALRRAVAGEPLDFRLDGTVSVDAGPLGQPSFGPATWLSGQLDTRAIRSRY